MNLEEKSLKWIWLTFYIALYLLSTIFRFSLFSLVSANVVFLSSCAVASTFENIKAVFQ